MKISREESGPLRDATVKGPALRPDTGIEQYRGGR